jgi:hypothetical protein
MLFATTAEAKSWMSEREPPKNLKARLFERRAITNLAFYFSC